MLDSPSNLYQEAVSVWTDGGWLMLPLFLLAVFMYYTALELYLHSACTSCCKANYTVSAMRHWSPNSQATSASSSA